MLVSRYAIHKNALLFDTSPIHGRSADSENVCRDKIHSNLFQTPLTMFYPRVVTIRFAECIVNSCNRGPNVAMAANSAVDTDVELPESQSRENCSLEVMT